MLRDDINGCALCRFIKCYCSIYVDHITLIHEKLKKINVSFPK